MRKETCPIFGSQVFQKSLNGSILKNDPKNVSARNFKDHNSESRLRFWITKKYLYSRAPLVQLYDQNWTEWDIKCYRDLQSIKDKYIQYNHIWTIILWRKGTFWFIFLLQKNIKIKDFTLGFRWEEKVVFIAILQIQICFLGVKTPFFTNFFSFFEAECVQFGSFFASKKHQN